MADVELQHSQVPPEHEEENAESIEGNLTDTQSELNGSHEADVEEPESPIEPPTDEPPASSASGDIPAGLDTMGPEDTPAAEAATAAESGDPVAATTPADLPKESPTSPTKPKAKATVTVKPIGKPSSTPGTPTVKKVLNSGTFGAGAARPVHAPTSRTTSASAPKVSAAASSLRKASSASTTAASRTGMPPVRQNSTATSATGPSRRASVVPKAATPTSGTAKPASAASARAPLSSSTASKPTTTRQSVTSPDSQSSLRSSTTSRPRASVTEGVKRPAPGPRASLGPSSSAGRPPSVSSRASRPTGSITSIREIKGDNKAIEELQSKLTEANSSLEVTTETVSKLESEVDGLKASLDAALADVHAKTAAYDELSQVKSHSESELEELKRTLANLQSSDDGELLKAVQDDLAAAKALNESQTELVNNLQSQIATLEEEVKAAKENLDVLRAASAEASSASAATAAVEHEALLKAQADLALIKEEIEKLKTAHATAIAEAEAQITSLKEQASNISALESQLEELKKGNEEKATKVSELEIEILELKEEQETAEDEHSKILSRVKSLEEELLASRSALEAATQASKEKEAEFLESIEKSSAAHAEELRQAKEEYEKLTERMAELEAELTAAIATHEQAKADAEASANAHRAQLEEAEQLHLAKQNQLAEEIQRIGTELDSQESKYNAKVDAVKAEHDQLLKEAYERAKSDAGSIHSGDLQKLRAESQATMEQLRTAHQTSIDSLKAEHEATIQSKISTLEKQISSLKIELRATQDDLVKSKSSFASVSQEFEHTKSQLDEARHIISSLDKTDKDETIAQLSKDLSNAKDDLVALTDMFEATKESLREITNNHATELEEAAKGRAEEVTKLRIKHQEELEALTSDRNSLTSRVSDLEGELATAKAQLNSDPLTSPRTNGSAHARTSSVTRDEIQKLHEAHNLKIYDLQAEHERVLRDLRAELEASQSKADGLNQELQRRAMEIQYLEQDQEESADQITRLKEDIEQLNEQLKATESH
ncbi:hypothetical protein ABKN59_001888 [Abortiporus biennis]